MADDQNDKDAPSEQFIADHGRYMRAAHAMQTGVGIELEYGPKDGTAKDLRVGINSCLSDLSGIATLLIEKGIITQDEYMGAIADAMEREVEMRTQRVRELTKNPNIHLG